MGIGDWGLGIGPNPQSPQFPFSLLVTYNKLGYLNRLLYQNYHNQNYKSKKSNINYIL